MSRYAAHIALVNLLISGGEFEAIGHSSNALFKSSMLL